MTHGTPQESNQSQDYEINRTEQVNALEELITKNRKASLAYFISFKES